MKKIKTIDPVLGNGQKLDGGAMFGNAPKALWSRWFIPDEQNRIELACRSLLLRSQNGAVILFEAGIGNFFEPKLRERYGITGERHILLKNLLALGVNPEDVTDVVLSHLHFDHAGGLLSSFEEGADRLVFPQAEFWVSERQWQRAKNPHARDRASYIPKLNELLEKSGRLQLISDTKAEISGEKISFIFSDGHTPGLMLSEISTEQGPITFASDLIPGIAWLNPALTMGYDRFPELLIDEKIKLLQRVASQKGSLFFTHDPQRAMGFVTQGSKGEFKIF